MKPPTTRTALKEIRQLRGLSNAELARIVGVSRQTIYSIEEGTFVPNTSIALQLARVLNVKVEDLFRLEAEQRGPEQVSCWVVPTRLWSPDSRYEWRA